LVFLQYNVKAELPPFPAVNSSRLLERKFMMSNTRKNILSKQEIIDIILEDLENNGPIMNKLQRRFDPLNMIRHVDTRDAISWFTPNISHLTLADLAKLNEKKGIVD